MIRPDFKSIKVRCNDFCKIISKDLWIFSKYSNILRTNYYSIQLIIKFTYIISKIRYQTHWWANSGASWAIFHREAPSKTPRILCRVQIWCTLVWEVSGLKRFRYRFVIWVSASHFRIICTRNMLGIIRFSLCGIKAMVITGDIPYLFKIENVR